MIYDATILVLAACLVITANSLNIQSVREGGCVERPSDPRFNQTWFLNTDFRYFPAGSKLNLYRLIQGHANFDQLREFEFYYDSCMRATPIENDEATLFAFNQPLSIASNFVLVKPGVIELDFTVQPRNKNLRPRYTITLTNNETFAFFHTCWRTTQDAGWMVHSTNSYFDEKWEKAIEEHAASLGFDRNNFAFMRRETCNHTEIY